MSDDTKVVENEEEKDTPIVEVQPGLTHEQVASHYKGLMAEAISTRDKAKVALRETRKELEAAKAALEKSKTLEGELTTLKTTIKTNSVKGALSAALKDAGALSVDTALKLIDVNQVEVDDQYNPNPEKLKALIDGLKESDAILFKAPDATPTAPVPGLKVARPASGQDGDPFIKELRSAKNEKEIDAVRAKYGR
jgi:hypothetical protein